MKIHKYIDFLKESKEIKFGMFELIKSTFRKVGLILTSKYLYELEENEINGLFFTIKNLDFDKKYNLNTPVEMIEEIYENADYIFYRYIPYLDKNNEIINQNYKEFNIIKKRFFKDIDKFFYNLKYSIIFLRVDKHSMYKKDSLRNYLFDDEKGVDYIDHPSILKGGTSMVVVPFDLKFNFNFSYVGFDIKPLSNFIRNYSMNLAELMYNGNIDLENMKNINIAKKIFDNIKSDGFDIENMDRAFNTDITNGVKLFEIKEIMKNVYSIWKKLN